MSDQFKGYNFLIVDDEPDLREIIRDEFEFAGATVAEADNGRQGFAIAQEKNIDVVISDIRMPGGDGAAMAKDIKSLNHEKPIVILITGFADLQSDEAYDMGVEGFITKPFNLSAICENVFRLLLPRSQRWKMPVTSDVRAQHNISESYQKLVELGKANFGRGGFFLQGDFSQFRVGDQFKFSFADLSGVGQFNWIRMDTVDSYNAGAGIEILSLNEDQIHGLDQYITKMNPTAFIPRR